MKFAYIDARSVLTYFDDAIIPASQMAGAVEITEAQYQDSLAHPGKYTIISGAFQLAPPPTAAQVNAQQWAAYQAQAKAALESSDTTMHRIGEAVALGKTTWTAADVVAFVQWRQQLRAILSQAQPAAVPAALPVQPAYPAGT